MILSREKRKKQLCHNRDFLGKEEEIKIKLNIIIGSRGWRIPKKIFGHWWCEKQSC